MIKETLAMFLIIVGHNVERRVIANHFNILFKVVDRNFTLTLRSICELAKDWIFHTKSLLSSHVISKSKFYPWFRVRLCI